jgi:acyl-coenzyme A synthetase/AMP-(fatty) acid ligase
MLVEKYNAQPGQRAFIYGDPGFKYYTAVFAAAELGIILIVDWPHCYTEEDLDSYKVNMFGQLDFVITYEYQHKDVDSISYYYWEHQRDLRYSNNIIYYEDMDQYEIQNPTRYAEISNTFYCAPDSVLLEYSSSGTTALPKKVINTHRKVYLMGERLSRLLSFNPEDRVLHTINLHHGASMVYHFLPSIMICRHHYTYISNDGQIDELVNFVKDNQLNVIYLYITKLLVEWLRATPRLDHAVKITTLYQISLECAKLIREKNIVSVSSPFGDTSIGLGFFIKTTTQDTPLENYDVNNYGPMLDSFFECKTEDGKLYVRCPALNEDWKTSDDLFEINERGEFCFGGRAQQYRINKEWIKLKDLSEMDILPTSLKEAILKWNEDKKTFWTRENELPQK